MQGRGRDVSTDTNPRIATKDLNVSRLMGYHLCWLCLAGHRRCHDRKKLGRFRCLATAAVRTEQARAVLPPPFEQHVGVEPVAQRQLRDRDLRFAGFKGQAALKFSRVIGPARPALLNIFTCVQNGPRYFVWRAPLSLIVTLFARRPQNDAYLRTGGSSISPWEKHECHVCGPD